MLYILNSSSNFDVNALKLTLKQDVQIINKQPGIEVKDNDFLIYFHTDEYCKEPLELLKKFPLRNIIVVQSVTPQIIALALEAESFDLIQEQENIDEQIITQLQNMAQYTKEFPESRKNLKTFITNIISEDFSLISEIIRFLEINSIMLIIHDDDGRIRYMNQKAKKTLEIEDFSSVLINELMGNIESIKIKRTSNKDRDIFQFKSRLITQKREIPVIITSSNIKNNKALENYTLLEITDISDKERFSSELINSILLNEALEQLTVQSLQIKTYKDLIRLIYRYAYKLTDITKCALITSEENKTYVYTLTAEDNEVTEEELEQEPDNKKFFVSEKLNTNPLYIYVFSENSANQLFLSKNKKLTNKEIQQLNKLNSVYKLISKFAENIINLRTSENKFKQLVESSIDIIIKIDRDYNIKYVNKAIEPIVNKKVAEIIGKNIDDFKMGRHNTETIKQSIDQIYEGEDSATFNLKLKLGINQKKLFNWRVYPEKDMRGNIISVVGIGRDITNLDTALNMLLDRAIRESTIFESLFDAVIMTDIKGRITKLNTAAMKLWGYSEKEAVGKYPNELFHQDKTGNLQKEIITAVMQSGSWSGEIAYITKQGKSGICESTVAKMTDAKNRIIGTISVSRDITAKKKQEEIIQQTLTKYQLSIEASPLGILLVDPAGNIKEVNNSAIKILGSPSTEYTKKLNFYNIKPLHEAGIIEDFKKCIKIKQVIVNEKEYTSVWGKTTYLRYHFTPYLNNETGEIEFIQTIIEDLSEVKKEQLEKEKLLLQLNQAKRLESIGRLAGGIAHDFNNLLTAIQFNISVALETLNQDSELYTNLKNIEKSSKRTSELVKQLLAYGRQQIVKPEVFSFKEQYYQFKNMLTSLIGEHIKIEDFFEIDEDYILADKNQIEQIIINLVANARDAMPNGGTITIKTEIETLEQAKNLYYFTVPPGTYVKIRVKDTGLGMSEQIITKIFEPFFTTKDINKGTGLGLSSVYGSVKQMGGFIEVWSRKKEGTEFILYFRKEETLANQQPIPSTTQNKPADKDIESEINALIVEDEEIIRKLTKKILKRAGFNVFAAENGATALKLLKKENFKPDLLVTDFLMPEMNGDILASKIKEKYPDIKILFTSGYSEELVNKEQSPGFNFIAKPYSPSELISKIKSIL